MLDDVQARLEHKSAHAKELLKRAKELEVENRVLKEARDQTEAHTRSIARSCFEELERSRLSPTPANRTTVDAPLSPYMPC